MPTKTSFRCGCLEWRIDANPLMLRMNAKAKIEISLQFRKIFIVWYSSSCYICKSKTLKDNALWKNKGNACIAVSRF